MIAYLLVQAVYWLWFDDRSAANRLGNLFSGLSLSVVFALVCIFESVELVLQRDVDHDRRCIARGAKTRPKEKGRPLWHPLLEDRAQTGHVAINARAFDHPGSRFSLGMPALRRPSCSDFRARSRRCRGTQSGLHERRPAKMEVPNELRLLDDQDQGPAELNDPNTVQHLGGAGRP